MSDDISAKENALNGKLDTSNQASRRDQIERMRKVRSLGEFVKVSKICYMLLNSVPLKGLLICIVVFQ